MNINKKILVIENDLNLYTKLSSDHKKFYKLFANSGIEGLKIAVKYQPDIIICDFQLNDLKCDKLFQQIRKKIAHKSIPFIAFTEDINDQSVLNMKRFPDVIIIQKPVKMEELHKEIDKILNPPPSEFIFDTISIENNKEKQKYEYIFIDQGKHLSTIKTDEIICALAKGNYTYIFSNEGKKYVVRKLLKEITEILPKETFLRIHRSTCINIRFIEVIEKLPGSIYKVKIKNYPDSLTISRRYRKNLKEKIIY